MEANYFGSFVDTNIVVRYLTGDPPEQAVEAARIINGGRGLQIPDVVLTETAYVLGRSYQFSREDIVDRLIDIVQRDNISIYAIDDELVLEGLMMCRPSGRVSIADALIWAAARSANMETIYTFDQRFPDEGIELRRSL